MVSVWRGCSSFQRAARARTSRWLASLASRLGEDEGRAGWTPARWAPPAALPARWAGPVYQAVTGATAAAQENHHRFGAAALLGGGLVLASNLQTPPVHAEEPVAGRFSGAVIIITGAAGDFGRAGAAAFKREGAHVVLLDVSEAALETAKKALADIPGPESIAIVCDVTQDSSVATAVGQAERTFGRITHLWNNAGYQGAVKPTDEYPLDDFQRVQDINVVGAFRVIHHVSRSMRQTGGGVIVNTASVAALRGTPAMPAYVASKAALLALTMTVAKDLAPHGIRVNAVSPALIGPGFMWDRQNELHAQSGSPYFARDPEAVGRGKLQGVPLKRLGSIDEVLKAVMFLLSDESSYCTGTNLVVDGGLAMR